MAIQFRLLKQGAVVAEGSVETTMLFGTGPSVDLRVTDVEADTEVLLVTELPNRELHVKRVGMLQGLRVGGAELPRGESVTVPADGMLPVTFPGYRLELREGPHTPSTAAQAVAGDVVVGQLPQPKRRGTTAVRSESPILQGPPRRPDDDSLSDDGSSDLTIEVENGPTEALILRLRGSLDAGTSEQFLELINDRVAEGYRRFLVDMRDVEYVNSAGLGALVRSADGQDGRRVAMVGVRTRVSVMFDMLGLNAFFQLFTDDDSALRFLAQPIVDSRSDRSGSGEASINLMGDGPTTGANAPGSERSRRTAGKGVAPKAGSAPVVPVAPSAPGAPAPEPDATPVTEEPEAPQKEKAEDRLSITFGTSDLSAHASAAPPDERARGITLPPPPPAADEPQPAKPVEREEAKKVADEKGDIDILTDVDGDGLADSFDSEVEVDKRRMMLEESIADDEDEEEAGEDFDAFALSADDDDFGGAEGGGGLGMSANEVLGGEISSGGYGSAGPVGGMPAPAPQSAPAPRREEEVTRSLGVPELKRKAKKSSAAPPPSPKRSRSAAPRPSRDEANAAPVESVKQSQIQPTPASSAAAPTTTNRPARTPVAGETLARKTTVRHWSQMNPNRNFPLLVMLTKPEIKVAAPTQRAAVQTEGKRQLEVKAAQPFVEIVPRFPGCICVPDRARVDVTPDAVEVPFWISPQSVGSLKDACVEVWYEGQLLDTIACPTRVRTPSLAKMAGALGVLAPVFFGTFETFTGTSAQEEMANQMQLTIPAIAESVGGFTNLGLYAGAMLLAMSVGGWWLAWPRRKQQPSESFFDVTLQPDDGPTTG